MIPTVALHLDIQAPENLDELAEERVYRAFAQGAMLGAQWIQGLWITRAHAYFHSTSRYVRGIEQDGHVEVIKQSATGGNVWEVIVEVTNTAKHASIVEDGHAAFSLPNAINWSKGGSIKQGENGPYLHIPFRHFAFVEPEDRHDQGMTRPALKAMMPREVYERAKRMRHSTRLNQGPLYEGTQFIAFDRYRWGDRLKRGQQSTAFHPTSDGWVQERRGERVVGRSPGRHGGPLINPAWKTSKYEGMVKMGGPRHSVYLTFRTLTPRSQGWNIPAQAGYGIARQVALAAQTHPEFSDIVRGAIQSELGGQARGG